MNNTFGWILYANKHKRVEFKQIPGIQSRINLNKLVNPAREYKLREQNQSAFHHVFLWDPIMTAAEITQKNTYTIDRIQDSPLSVNFLEIGLIPGKTIQILHRAPFHGPIAFQVDDNILAIREQEAKLIIVR